MKTASTALQNLLTSGDFVRCDLYTFTLVGGAVYRYSGADRVIRYGGQTFALGVKIATGNIKTSVGLQSNPVTLKIASDASDVLAGAEFLAAIRANALDGAAVRIDRVYAPTWEAMASVGPTGGLVRFSGRFSAISSLSRTTAQIDVAPWTELLNVNMPTNVYQPTCLHTLFDAGCGLSRAAFAVTGTVGASPTTTAIATTLTNPAGYFTLGKIVFTSGALNGVQRTIKSSDASGNLTFVQPLPAAPAPGDAFTAYPGCDGQQGTCGGKFANLAHFRGFPYVPPPEQAL